MNYSDANELISVVIPVYNCEKYIDKCITSVINQSYSKLEIIIVDDGSTDKSPRICEKYSLLDKRIRVIHKKNGGLSDARNVGIENATGEYITFIDGDDYVSKEYIFLLYSNMILHNADISICELNYITENGIIVNRPINTQNVFLYNRKQSIINLLKQKPYSNSACVKLYRMSLFSKIRFPYKRLYEDIGTVYKIFLKASRVVFVTSPCYYYVQRSGSITTSKFTPKQMDNLIFAYKMIKDILIIYPDLYDLAACRIVDSCVELLNKKKVNRFPFEYKAIWNILCKVRSKALFSRRASLKRRIYACASYLGKKLFMVFLNITNRVLYAKNRYRSLGLGL